MHPDQMASSEASWSGTTVFPKEINSVSAGRGLKQCVTEHTHAISSLFYAKEFL